MGQLQENQFHLSDCENVDDFLKSGKKELPAWFSLGKLMLRLNSIFLRRMMVPIFDPVFCSQLCLVKSTTVFKWIPKDEKFVIARLLIKKVKNMAKLKEMKMDELVDTSPTAELIQEFNVNSSQDYSSKAKSHLQDPNKVRTKKSSKERKRARRLLTTNLDRYYSRISNLILEMVRRAAIEMGSSEYRPPIISIGYYPRNKELMNRLSEHFLVIAVGEYLTSKRCSRCHGYVRITSKTTHRRYYCKNQKCYHSGSKEYVQNKDVSAAVNMVFILLGIIFNGVRPAAFSKPVVAS